MNNNLHHKLSSVLRYIIPLVKDSEQKSVLNDFYRRTEIPFANKGTESYIQISRLSYEVLEYIEENLL